MNLSCFEECIKASTNGPRHILLGNGFSRACRNEIFSYDSLFEEASWNDNERLKSIFDLIKTRDFEQVMEILEDSI